MTPPEIQINTPIMIMNIIATELSSPLSIPPNPQVKPPIIQFNTAKIKTPIRTILLTNKNNSLFFTSSEFFLN